MTPCVSSKRDFRCVAVQRPGKHRLGVSGGMEAVWFWSGANGPHRLGDAQSSESVSGVMAAVPG